MIQAIFCFLQTLLIPESGEGADAIRDATRKAPHNAYVRIPRMLEIAKNQGYSLDGGKSPFHFKEDAPENERGDIKDITLNFSQSTFKAEFKYDSASNTYDRYIAGKPNTERKQENRYLLIMPGFN